MKRVPAVCFFLIFALLGFLVSPKSANQIELSSNAAEAQNYQYEYLSKEEYVELRKFVMKIREAYPPNEYFYLGLGQSPTALVALLQVFGDQATSIPLSNIRKLREENVDLDKLSRLLAPHLQVYLPSEEELRGKKILALDFANEGLSLVLSKKIIDRFLLERKSQSEAVYLGFHLPGARYEFEAEDGRYLRPLVKDRLSSEGIFAWKLVGNSWMADSFYGEGFDFYSEFGSYSVKKLLQSGRVSTTASRAVSNPEYRKFQEELHFYFRQDRALQNKIRVNNKEQALSCRKILF